MELKHFFCRCKVLRSNMIRNVHQTMSCSLYSSSIDTYLNSLVIDGGSKKETSLLKYFNNSSAHNLQLNINNSTMEIPILEKWNARRTGNNSNLISEIEYEIREETRIPNKKLYFILTYFVQNGDIDGVKTIQLIVEKNNITHFKLYSEYKHYMAEALWISGKIENSLKLFSVAYDNELVRPQVIVMLKCLFPLLISQHSEVLLNKIVCSIEQFSVKRNDFIILAFIWKELFQSEWFSDQELSKELLKRNYKMLSLIYFMIPSMGKMLLKEHNIETFHRLFEFTLINELDQDETLIRLLFDYYYIQQNIERCSEVVRYCIKKSTSPLTEEQQRRYASLLHKNKNASISKPLIKKTQHLKFRF